MDINLSRVSIDSVLRYIKVGERSSGASIDDKHLKFASL